MLGKALSIIASVGYVSGALLVILSYTKGEPIGLGALIVTIMACGYTAVATWRDPI